MLRRIWSLILIILITVIAACTGQSPVAETQNSLPISEVPDLSTPASQYHEAPVLAESVAAGELPPVEERLPEEPFVVGPGVYLTEEDLPDWAPGKYGGTLRIVHISPDWSADGFVMLSEPFLTAPKISDQGIVCNICQDFQVSEDNKVFTFTLRQGLKWSDGVPVTTEDVRFVWEDIHQNEQLTPTFPQTFRTGRSPSGNPGTLEILDEYTFQISFDAPYGSFLRALAIESWAGYTELLGPAHYLKPYHINYTSLEALQPELEALNLTEEWWQVFQAKFCGNWKMTSPSCAGYPALNPWTGVATGSSDQLRFERNPYYFKIDTLGQQLPYIDTVESTLTADMEMANLKILSGEVDFGREFTSLVKIPLYKESEAKAGYQVVLLDMHVDPTGLVLNQTFDDPNWRAVSQDIRFRQAVSLAINRQELINTVYYGYASLPLKTVGEEYSRYDLAEANRLLDEMGLDRTDSEGYRLYPDGSLFEILLEYAARSADFTSVVELLPHYLKEIGIKVTIKQIDSQLFSEKELGNGLQATISWSQDVGWGNSATTGNAYNAGALWGWWHYFQETAGEEPPEWVKEAFQMDAQKWEQVPGTPEYNALVEKGYAWCRANLPYITFVEEVKYPLIVKTNLKNIPRNGYAIAAVFSAVQMYFDTP